jgi:hypothetical protein
VLFFALYTVAFRSAGLSPAQISSLFVIWSVASFLVEIPSGAWADAFSRRRLLAFAAVLRAAGFAAWTAALLTGSAAYPAFALGFVLWGTCSAIKSGCLQALVYDELLAVGSPGSYLRLIGRGESVALVSMLVAIALAAPAYRVGGYLLVGAASVGVSLVNAGVALAMPERGRTRGTVADPAAAYVRELRAGLAEVRRRPVVRRAVFLMAGVGTFAAIDEYVPLWLAEGGASTVAVPLLLVPPALAMAAGAWWAERWAGAGPRGFAAALVLAAAALAAGAAGGQPAGIVGITVFCVLWTAGRLVAEARLQESIEVSARATVLSVGGLGVEVGRLLLHGGYALGSVWYGSAVLVALAAVPMVLIAAASPRWLPEPRQPPRRSCSSG